MNRPLLLGHRGQCDTRGLLVRRLRPSSLPPENTLDAFELALQRGCDGVEFDVRFTRDGQAVLCHDPDYAGFNLASAEYSTIEQQARLRDTHIPLLEEALTSFAHRAYLDIEIKVPGFESQVLDIVRQRSMPRGCVVSSFLPEVLRSLHELDADLPLGYICKERKLLSLWHDLPVTHVIPHYTLVFDALMREWHEEGKQVLVWTVNRRDDILRMRDQGVQGIISDETALLRQLLSQS